jgi:hypothetical protein
MSNARQHPFQTGATALLSLLGGSVAGPGGAQAGSGLGRYLFGRYNQSNAPEGLPGIIGPNTYAPSSESPGISGALGIPNYGSGNVGWQPANSFGTGNFSSGNGNLPPLLDLNYGQNPQEYQMEGGGLPGITGPNIYAGSAQGANNQSANPNYSRASGNLQSLGGMGRTVGTATMSQVEDMLASGPRRGENNLTPGREIGQERAEARRQCMTLRQYRNQS